MGDSETPRAAVAAELDRLLTAYLDGQSTLEDFLAWEAELSLDPERAGDMRPLLDRLSIVAAEVCDGVRDAGEFRALARETVYARSARRRTAVAEAPASYRASSEAH